MTYILYTDGGSRGNPGPAAIGVVLKSENNETIKEVGMYIGHATNNEAEYRALSLGLEIAKERNAEHLICFLDSELVVKQMSGKYKIKNENLKNYWKKIKEQEKDFEKVEYTHIRREKNTEADLIVNKVLDNNL